MSDPRRSYRILSRLPSWSLTGSAGQIVASVRAPNAQEARMIFRSCLSSADVERGRRVQLTKKQ